MRKTFMLAVIGFLSFSLDVSGQDSLKTTSLNEVVITGTKFDIPVEKSGKTIFKISREDIEKNSGKSLADLLNEVPGIQTDGNFSTPGSNLSYYVRGGRNRHALILIDGVPLNDPSAINAEYDLRYISLSQIENIEVLKGGLSTLYGTSAASGVINITLKKPADKKFDGELDLQAGSFGTFSQNIQASGTANKLSYFINGGNSSSEGFSSAQDNDPNSEFDKDGFSRQNILAKLGYAVSDRFTINFQTAYEKFEADFDAFEFFDADNRQENNQIRIGLTPEWKYEKGKLSAKLFYNENEKEYFSAFPSHLKGKNFQGEIIHQHRFSDVLSLLSGINFQDLSSIEFVEPTTLRSNMNMLDPYTSLFIDLPSGFNFHGGVRLNTHSVYGSKFIYNLNPSFTLNKNGYWNYKVFASLSTSYVTPSLYQLYSSFYGNENLKPEEAVNFEGGFSVLQNKFTFTSAWFQRDESQPIDFVSLFDSEGNYIGGEYRNIVSDRTVNGVEFTVKYNATDRLSLSGNYSFTDTDKPASFYKIPKHKYGLTVSLEPVDALDISVKYNFTGDRTTFDFSAFSEVKLDSYQLVDVFASYILFNKKLTLYAAVNNLFDEKFIALYGYTTRGRNYNTGIRYRI